MLTLRRDPNNTAADSFVIPEGENDGSIEVPLTTIDKLVAGTEAGTGGLHQDGHRRRRAAGARRRS